MKVFVYGLTLAKKSWLRKEETRKGKEQPDILHCVHSNLIYNSQKLERTQMSLNSGIDTEIVVHFHSGLLLRY
jgi:hypothetical protein